MTTPEAPNNQGCQTMLARAVPKEDMAELRIQVPRFFLEVFDAVSIARDQERFELVTEELAKIVGRYVHEASLIQRVTRGNPALMESFGKAGGDVSAMGGSRQ